MRYVAFLRGIGPGNPNMRNDKLRSVAESLGFSNVQSVISSGNLLFETNDTDTNALEATFEAAWPKHLGFTSTTIIRSQKQIDNLIEADPFKGYEHGSETYLLVTFLKHTTPPPQALPQATDGTYKILKATKNEIYTVTDATATKTPDVMAWLEKQYGKQISSRTWKTILKISAKLTAL